MQVFKVEDSKQYTNNVSRFCDKQNLPYVKYTLYRQQISSVRTIKAVLLICENFCTNII